MQLICGGKKLLQYLKQSLQQSDKAEVEAGDGQGSNFTLIDPDSADESNLTQETSLPTASDDWDKLFLYHCLNKSLFSFNHLS